MTDLVTYDDVNAAWGGLMLPPITAASATPIYNKLVRKFGGREMRLPSYAHRVNRSWAAPRGSDTKRPAANGLPRMVHDASHWVFERLNPRRKPHGPLHAALEKQMIEHVIAEGWHLPKAPPSKPTPGQRTATELANVEARIKRWQTKARRAATALRKLARKQKRLAARLGAA